TKIMASMSSCFAGSVSSEAKLISKEIERKLKEAKREAKSQVKLLVLGAAESGKSTFIKQMRIIHGTGYNSEELASHIPLIYQNINVSVKVLATAMLDLGIPYEHERNKLFGDECSELPRDCESTLTTERVLSIMLFWKDEGVQECYLRRNEFHLLDSAAYYLSSLNRISSPTYLPTLQDVLRSRSPTLGITEYLFTIDSFMFGIVDVGGQKTERRKWIHCFENITSIIFLAALSEHIRCYVDSETINRQRESNALFKTIVNGQWFKQTSVILFLNKTDVLEEKIQHSHLVDYFPEYDGPKQDATSAQFFILGKYQESFEDNKKSKRTLYSHFTCATDTENIKFVFKAIKDIILQSYLSNYNLI
uniref:Uncharacterized protein n=1 Tax=Ciona savignyi TaxID=51511 RepID=H2Z9X4_CIOSA